MFLLNIKLLTFKHFRKYIFNIVLTNLIFMDFLFHAPFFLHCCCCDNWDFGGLFLNVEFRERKKLILNQVLISSNIISPVPKLPESTRRKQAIFNKGSLLFYSHCAWALGTLIS
jgi:hypothetical protein